jgi:predicted metalloprotease with PDZ domain
MKKFLISETEKKEILDKHKSFKLVLENKFKQKLVLSEQLTSPTGNELIQKAKNVCPTLKNGVFVKIKGNRAIKITAAKDGSLSAVNNQPKYVVVSP